MDKFLSTLNDSQRAAVLYNEGPSLIIAGAGSGKTRVLTYKIAYLLKLGLSPYSIMALTFTNKAAREMKERIARVVGEDTAKRLWMGTFHSIFSRILRQNAELIGFKYDFTIYDSSDSKNLIKTIVKEMGLDDKIYKPGAVQAQISNAKNHLITPGMYAANKELVSYDIQTRRPQIAEIYKRYWNRCYQSGAMDFDDLLLYTNILFRDHKSVLEKYQDYFQFILVDEYQDTNMAQHLIVEMLAKKHNRVCVVGDDAQSIYSFRGANIANILNFRNTIPGTKIFKLEQNYRSTKTIVKAADSLIKKNREQIEKNIFSENKEGEQIQVCSTYSDFEEAYLIANRIMDIKIGTGCSYSDFAILYRMNAQSRLLEEALRKRNIPYRIYGGLSFYQRKEIKDVISYFRMATNPSDEEAFKRIINYPARGIGDTTVNKIAQAALLNQVSYYTVINDPIGYGLKINSGTANKIAAFRGMIEAFRESFDQKDAFEMAEMIIKQSGIMNELFADKSVESISRQENIQELVNGIREFITSAREEGRESATLSDFLAEVSLATDQDNEKDTDEDKVTLMTVHASKGLEFRNVFIAGVEEDIFPSAMAKDEPGGVEEERRLMYVAITRAEQLCTLTYAASRYRNGQPQTSSPSRFIRDIDPKFLNLPAGTQLREKATENARTFATRSRMEMNARANSGQNENKDVNKPNEAPASASGYAARRLTPVSGMNKTRSVAATIGAEGNVKPGNLISHSRFGKGKVASLEGDGESAKAIVDFENVGRKQLLLKFAKFDIIG